MIAFFNIQQGTPEWFAHRYRKIGGSTSHGLFVNSDTLLDEMVGQFLEPFEMPADSYQSEHITRGIEDEPLARYHLSLYTGVDFKECGWFQSEECDLLGISPDGTSLDLETSCEIKCPARKEHAKTLRLDIIPTDHISQCLHYFTVNPKLKTHYFCSFRKESEKPLFVKKMTRDMPLDLGFTEKGTITEDRGKGIKEYVCVNPVIKTIDEWCKLAISNGLALENKITETLAKINGI